jgi:hypothetical protein
LAGELRQLEPCSATGLGRVRERRARRRARHHLRRSLAPRPPRSAPP